MTLTVGHGVVYHCVVVHMLFLIGNNTARQVAFGTLATER